MSRRGAHLWILCEQPLPARLCRIYIYSLALRLDVPIKGAFKQVDGIEVFPRQDEIGAAEFGNAIRGPLGIHRANMHRYWFEDAPSNLADQLSYLRSVKRLTAMELQTFTKGTVDPGLRLPAAQRSIRRKSTIRGRIPNPPAREGPLQAKRQLLGAVPILRPTRARPLSGQPGNFGGRFPLLQMLGRVHARNDPRGARSARFLNQISLAKGGARERESA